MTKNYHLILFLKFFFKPPSQLAQLYSSTLHNPYPNNIRNGANGGLENTEAKGRRQRETLEVFPSFVPGPYYTHYPKIKKNK